MLRASFDCRERIVLAYLEFREDSHVAEECSLEVSKQKELLSTHDSDRSTETRVNTKTPDGNLRPISTCRAVWKPTPVWGVLAEITHQYARGFLHMEVEKIPRANTLEGVKHPPFSIELLEETLWH